MKIIRKAVFDIAALTAVALGASAADMRRAREGACEFEESFEHEGPLALAAYSTANPPVSISVGPLAGFNANEPGGTNTTPRLWTYSSADPIATVQGAGYFSNGLTLGMRVGDLVEVIDNNLLRRYPSFVTAVTPTAGAPAVAGTGSATINSGTTLTAA